MTSSSSFSIRSASISDIQNLKTFFIKAYGEETVFRDEKFLLYYFGSGSSPLNACVIAVNLEGEIVSHYGGVPSQFRMPEKTISLVWGVNAYTLPEWRGKGINSEMVNYVLQNNEANAVIGMPFDAPAFYQKIGYNIFQKNTFDRFVCLLDEHTFDIITYIGQDVAKAKELLPITQPNFEASFHNIVELTKENFKTFVYNLNPKDTCTTDRNIDFLSWRLFNNPYINYKIYGYIDCHSITAYIAMREETLMPMSATVNRIIDLLGTNEGVNNLLQFVISKSKLDKALYVDFSMFGKLYQEILQVNGFTKLQNENVCLLPQVSAPVANRPNHEFIVIQSSNHHDSIKSLSQNDVYFTRIDGDRDRINKLHQINSPL